MTRDLAPYRLVRLGFAVTLVALAPLSLTPLSQAAPAPTISGRVVDAQGLPVTGVEVVDEYGRNFDATDGEGRFQVLLDTSRTQNAIVTRQNPEPGASISGQTTTRLSSIATPAEGVDVGDMTLWRLGAAQRIMVVDADGDPVRQFMVRGNYCETAARPDVASPEQAAESRCWTTVHEYNIYKPYVYEIAFPNGPELAAVIDSVDVSLRDPATDTPYAEKLADANYDSATKTYRLEVAGIDAPPVTLPPSPTAIKVHNQVNGFFVEWDNYQAGENQAPASGHGIEVRDSSGAVVLTQQTDTGSFQQLGGLVKGPEYRVTVTRLSEFGESAPSAPVTFRSATRPIAPQDFAVSTARRTATFTWTPIADDGGLPTKTYIVIKGREIKVPITASTHTAKKLDPGRYTVYLRAVNDKGPANSNPAKFRITR